MSCKTDSWSNLFTRFLIDVEWFLYLYNSTVCDLYVFLWGASVHIHVLNLVHEILQRE